MRSKLYQNQNIFGTIAHLKKRALIIIKKLIMHSFFSSRLRYDMWQWSVCCYYRNSKIDIYRKWCPSFRQNGIQEYATRTYLEAAKTYFQEMKKNYEVFFFIFVRYVNQFNVHLWFKFCAA